MPETWKWGRTQAKKDEETGEHWSGFFLSGLEFAVFGQKQFRLQT